MTNLALKNAVKERYTATYGKDITQLLVNDILDIFFQIFEEELGKGRRVPLGRICRLQQVWRKPPYIGLACRASTVMKRKMNPHRDK